MQEVWSSVGSSVLKTAIIIIFTVTNMTAQFPPIIMPSQTYVPLHTFCIYIAFSITLILLMSTLVFFYNSQQIQCKVLVQRLSSLFLHLTTHKVHMNITSHSAHKKNCERYFHKCTLVFKQSQFDGFHPVVLGYHKITIYIYCQTQLFIKTANTLS
jgi:hypothetical protein